MKKVYLRSLFSSRTFLLLTIYLVYMFCTLFWADSLGLADLSKYGRRVMYILIFVGVTIHLTRSYSTFIQRLLVLLCCTGSIVAVATIVLYYRQNPFPSTRLFGYGLLHNPFKASSLYGITACFCPTSPDFWNLKYFSNTEAKQFLLRRPAFFTSSS